jgi:hypothetical protein
MNTNDTIFLNWYILMAIWKIEHECNSEREKARFHYATDEGDEVRELTFFRLFYVDSRTVYGFIKGGRNFNKKKIEALIKRTNISQSVFEGTRLLIPVDESDDLYHKLVVFVRNRRNEVHPSKYRDLYKAINDYLESCKKDLSYSNPIDPELKKAFSFIANGYPAEVNQNLILNMAKGLSRIKYKTLLDIDSQYLFTYLKELKKQEKLVMTAITHRKNIK